MISKHLTTGKLKLISLVFILILAGAAFFFYDLKKEHTALEKEHLRRVRTEKLIKEGSSFPSPEDWGQENLKKLSVSLKN